MQKLIIPMLLVVLAVAFIWLIFAADFTIYVNTFALTVVPVLGTVHSFIVNGLKNSIKAFSLPFTDTATNDQLKTSLKFFHMLEKSYMLFGVAGMLVSMVDMFRNLEDASLVAMRFASSIACIALAFLLVLLFVIPYQGILDKRLHKNAENAEGTI
jgi:hypothetical protein